MERMKLGVLGGTFDPLHLGHLILAEVAREQLRLARVLFIPAGRPWRKAKQDLAPAEDRLAMVRLGIGGRADFDVATLEIDRPGPSYTADTLEGLCQQQPGAEPFFIMGQDALLDLPNWRRAQRIPELAWLAVARRPGERGDLARAEAAVPGLTERVVWLDMPLVEISASAIRERVRRGLSIRYMVPDAVASYIQEHGLYRA